MKRKTPQNPKDSHYLVISRELPEETYLQKSDENLRKPGLGEA